MRSGEMATSRKKLWPFSLFRIARMRSSFTNYQSKDLDYASTCRHPDTMRSNPRMQLPRRSTLLVHSYCA